MRLGFIGLGTMGGPMAACLVGGGHQVTVFDVAADRMAPLVERGAMAASKVIEAATGAAAVFVSLPSAAAAEAVVLDETAGLVAAMAPGSVLVDLSTNSRQLTARIGEAMAARGVKAVDAPVSSISGPASEGKLTVMIGGDDAVVAEIRPLLQLIGTNLVHLGPHGAGTVAKLMTQYLGLTALVVDMEAMLVAAKAGIDLDKMLELVPNSIGGNFMFRVMRELTEHHDFGEPGKVNGLVEIMGKDIRFADALASDLGIPNPVGGAAAAVFAEAIERGFGPYHFTRVIEILEEGGGIELRMPEEPNKEAS
jgi:3-hydroxyisobutyrate dehydrogenase-like beta-hydroxyacid dehydrogenase